MKRYTTIDLFAGAGGLSYGFLETGKFDIKVAVEHNKYAQETYKENHPGTEIESDIKLITNDKYRSIKEKYKEVDVVVGGPPCQGFSNANRQKNELISGNNQLVNEYIRAVEQLQPKAFVMENVKSINSSKHKFFCNEEIRTVIEELEIKLREETIAIAEATICIEEFIYFLQRAENLKEYLLNQPEYIKLNTIYRNSKTLMQLRKYVKKSEPVIKKMLDGWESTNLTFWSSEYENVFYETKEKLSMFTIDNTGYDELRNALKIIIETQKAIYKIQELRDYKVPLINMTQEKSNICITVNTFNVIEYVIKKFKALGYDVETGVLNAANYGVPQTRERFIIIGVKKEYLKKESVQLPNPILKDPEEFYTIREAIYDLSEYEPGVNIEYTPIRKKIEYRETLNPLQRYLDSGDIICNHIVTNTRDTALERFRSLGQGQNFHSLHEDLKKTYSDPTRTQNTIYLRLNYGTPSGTVLNVRKSMWVHPEIDRAISIREAARLQSFPDTFVFCGPKDAQYQQIGNAVPPLLGRAIAEKLLELIGDEPHEKLNDLIIRK